jgi:predicted GNAT superfamily acetyltransferase
MTMRIRDVAAADFPALLALNEESVHFLSPLDAPRLASLHSHAAYHRLIEIDGQVAGFLLAFRERAPYDSPNFLWFAARHSSFLYIDRVVVSSAQQGLGIGRRLYEDLFAFARETAAPCITCEFDVEPPNPQSQRFHERFGFREVGSQRVGPSQKRVSLQRVELSA